MRFIRLVNFCLEPGKENPTWHIKADEITHDSDEKTIRYKNVRLEVAGIPILYSPYLAHPDPSVRSRSGLLPPTRLGNSTELGAYISVPYFFDISQSQDFTFEPIINKSRGHCFRRNS